LFWNMEANLNRGLAKIGDRLKLVGNKL